MAGEAVSILGGMVKGQIAKSQVDMRARELQLSEQQFREEQEQNDIAAAQKGLAYLQTRLGDVNWWRDSTPEGRQRIHQLQNLYEQAAGLPATEDFDALDPRPRQFMADIANGQVKGYLDGDRTTYNEFDWARAAIAKYGEQWAGNLIVKMRNMRDVQGEPAMPGAPQVAEQPKTPREAAQFAVSDVSGGGQAQGSSASQAKMQAVSGLPSQPAVQADPPLLESLAALVRPRFNINWTPAQLVDREGMLRTLMSARPGMDTARELAKVRALQQVIPNTQDAIEKDAQASMAFYSAPDPDAIMKRRQASANLQADIGTQIDRGVELGFSMQDLLPQLKAYVNAGLASAGAAEIPLDQFESTDERLVNAYSSRKKAFEQKQAEDALDLRMKQSGHAWNEQTREWARADRPTTVAQHKATLANTERLAKGEGESGGKAKTGSGSALKDISPSSPLATKVSMLYALGFSGNVPYDKAMTLFGILQRQGDIEYDSTSKTWKRTPRTDADTKAGTPASGNAAWHIDGLNAEYDTPAAQQKADADYGANGCKRFMADLRGTSNWNTGLERVKDLGDIRPGDVIEVDAAKGQPGTHVAMAKAGGTYSEWITPNSGSPHRSDDRTLKQILSGRPYKLWRPKSVAKAAPVHQVQLSEAAQKEMADLVDAYPDYGLEDVWRIVQKAHPGWNKDATRRAYDHVKGG